jgi:hypothetical protein
MTIFQVRAQFNPIGGHFSYDVNFFSDDFRLFHSHGIQKRTPIILAGSIAHHFAHLKQAVAIATAGDAFIQIETEQRTA